MRLYRQISEQGVLAPHSGASRYSKTTNHIAGQHANFIFSLIQKDCITGCSVRLDIRLLLKSTLGIPWINWSIQDVRRFFYRWVRGILI